MLVLRAVLQANKGFLKVNTRQHGFIYQKFLKVSPQCLPDPYSSGACLHTRNKPCLQPPNSFGSSLSNHRHLTQEPKGSKFVSRHKTDKISKDYELIYSNGIVKYYQASQFLLYPLTMFGAISSAYLMWTSYEDFFTRAVDMGDHPFIAGCTFLVVCSAMLAVFANLCRRALLRIYINPQTGDYVGVRYPWNFLKGQIDFTKSEVEVGRNESIVPFYRNNIKIKGQPFLIVGRDFINAHQYNTFVGHQESYDDDDDEGK